MTTQYRKPTSTGVIGLSDDKKRRGFLRRRSTAVVAAASALLLGAAGIAASVSTGTSSSYTFTQRYLTNDSAWTGAGTGWTDVPGMATSVTIPSGSTGVIDAAYTAESLCDGSNSSWCSVRVTYQKSGGSLTEALPASGTDFAFDAPGTTNGYDWESHAIERSTPRLAAGTYTVKVQALRNGATALRLDDMHLKVGAAY